MATTIQKKYETATAARAAFKSVLDATERGRTVTVVRDDYVAAIVAADRLQDYFARTVSPHAKAFFENGLWVVLLEDRPFASEGAFGVVHRLGLTLRFAPPQENPKLTAQRVFDKGDAGI